jgi:predicted metal-dependent hydrolase
MKEENILFYVIVAFIMGICLKVYMESDAFNLKCIISDVDGNKYCVRERSKLVEVADLLARVTQKLKDLVTHMKNKYPERDNVKRLVENFNPKKIQETLPTSVHTAYSENKGEKMAFCVTKKKNGVELIDENTLTFVAIHELAHVGTKSIGHKDEFWKNFKFLLENAKEAKIYSPEDYKKKPKSYCGMNITDNPYFDL